MTTQEETAAAQAGDPPSAPVWKVLWCLDAWADLAARVAAQTLGERLQSDLFFEALRRTV